HPALPSSPTRRSSDLLNVAYPVAVDNDRAIWRAFQNRYWPAHYFIDAKGRIRYHHFGEGNYAASERVIQRLLAEASPDKAFDGADRKSTRLNSSHVKI